MEHSGSIKFLSHAKDSFPQFVESIKLRAALMVYPGDRLLVKYTFSAQNENQHFFHFSLAPFYLLLFEGRLSGPFATLSCCLSRSYTGIHVVILGNIIV